MIDLIKVNKTYHNKLDAVQVLNNFSYKFESTGIYFILAKSGEGKTTLLNIIGGFDKIDTGEVFIDGKNITKMSDKQLSDLRASTISYLFQEKNLLNNFTIMENVKLNMSLKEDICDDEIITNLFKKFNIDMFLNNYPNELSTGQKQKIATAMLILKKPKIILADEPTGSLDTVQKFWLIKVLRELSKTSLVIIVTHDQKLTNRDDTIITLKEDSSCEVEASSTALETTKLKSQKLPLRQILLLAFRQSKKNKQHLLYTFTIFVISFSLIFAALSFFNFNIFKSFAQEISNGQITHLLLEKNTNDNSSDLFGLTSQLYLDDNDIDNLKYYAKEVFPIFDDYNDNSLMLDYSIQNLYTYDQITGSTEITDEQIENLDFDLIHGEMPKSYNEVMISKFLGNVLLASQQFDNINSDQLPGNIIHVNNNSFYISGIIDTHFDEYNDFTHFSNYYSLDELNETEMIKYGEFIETIDYGWTNLLFFKTGYFNSVLKSTYNDKIDFINHNFNKFIFDSDFSKNTLDFIYDDNTYGLVDNQIVISYKMLDFETKREINNLSQSLKNNLIFSFALENFQDIEQSFIADNGPSSSEDYAYYIMQSDVNLYHPSFDQYFFLDKAREEVILDKSLTYQIKRFDYVETFEVIDIDFDENQYYSCTISSENYDAISNSIGVYQGVILNFNDADSFINLFSESENHNYTYIIQNGIFNDYILCQNSISVYEIIFSILGLVLGLTAFIFMTLITRNRIDQDMSNIGLLKSWGCTNKTIFSVYFSYNSIALVLCSLISILINYLLMLYLNFSVFKLSFFYMNLNNILIFMLFVLMSAIIITYSSIFRLFTKKIMDIIIAARKID